MILRLLKAKCPMDGAWKQLEYYAVKNKDTTLDNGFNYKICKDGYIIWEDFHRNAAQKDLQHIWVLVPLK